METALYIPVKRFLERLGFDVKGEIRGCDIVALKGEEPLVVVTELKLSFTLELVLQGVDRTAACDEVWLAVKITSRGREQDSRARKLCRLLGFGLLGVTRAGRVEVLVEPVPWRPRRDKARRSQLVEEHRRRRGDPVKGGGTRAPALSLGPRRVRELKAAVPEAPSILLRNVYGWFVRVERGIYALAEPGRAALVRWPPAA